MIAPTKANIKAACEELSRADTALDHAYKAVGVPQWRARPASYETIATTIAYQQICTHAAASIWARVKEDLKEITIETMLGASDERLRALGLSRPKVAHLKSVATALQTGALSLDRIARASLDDARAELLSVKGIGPWTGDLFLLYALGEMDAFPAGDVALIEAYRQLSGGDTRLLNKAFTSHAERWRPWRGVAAHLLWGWVHFQRARG